MTLFLADAGVPMLFVGLPVVLAALIPVVGAEVWVARRRLSLPLAKALPAVVTANVVSTLVGYPLLWLLLFGVQLAVGGTSGSSHGLHGFWLRLYSVTIQAPWLLPDERQLYWMVPVAGVYLLIPAFFLSVYLERWICRLFWKGVDFGEVRRFSWSAHFLSYAVLLAVAAGFYFHNRR